MTFVNNKLVNKHEGLFRIHMVPSGSDSIHNYKDSPHVGSITECTVFAHLTLSRPAAAKHLPMTIASTIVPPTPIRSTQYRQVGTMRIPSTHPNQATPPPLTTTSCIPLLSTLDRTSRNRLPTQVTLHQILGANKTAQWNANPLHTPNVSDKRGHRLKQRMQGQPRAIVAISGPAAPIPRHTPSSRYRVNPTHGTTYITDHSDVEKSILPSPHRSPLAVFATPSPMVSPHRYCSVTPSSHQASLTTHQERTNSAAMQTHTIGRTTTPQTDYSRRTKVTRRTSHQCRQQ